MKVKHGESHPRTPEYEAWAAMKKRCCRKSYEGRKRYGDRGIAVCEKWRNDYSAFLADVGRKPSPQHSLDRIDNNGDYAPGNVRWATGKEQQRNKGNNALVSYQGVERCIAQWADIVGISRKRLEQRLRAGWSAEVALTTPVDQTTSAFAKKRWDAHV